MANENRRTFFRRVFGGVIAAVSLLSSRLVYAKKYGVKLSQLKQLSRVGGSVSIKLGGREMILIRVSKSGVKAIDAVCTHQKCLVGYMDTEKKIACKCHGSYFDLNGKVLTGPASKPLRTYPAQMDGERLIITVPNE